MYRFAEQYHLCWMVETMRGLRTHPTPHCKQKQIRVDSAAVHAHIHVQRVVPSKASCTGIVPRRVHDAQGIAQTVLQVHTGSDPDGISYLTCILHRTRMDSGKPKGCRCILRAGLDTATARHRGVQSIQHAGMVKPWTRFERKVLVPDAPYVRNIFIYCSCK